MDGQYQNNIPDMQGLEAYRYENIFKVYETGTKNFRYYNILKKIQIPKDINNTLFYNIVLPPNMPFTTLSYNLYGTTYLWWLICIINNINNPFDKTLQGKKVKVIKREFIKPIVDNIRSQLQ